MAKNVRKGGNTGNYQKFNRKLAGKNRGICLKKFLRKCCFKILFAKIFLFFAKILKNKNKWTIPKLVKRFGNSRFAIGQEANTKWVKLKFQHFARYLKTTKDDSPMTIFDEIFNNSSCIKLREEQGVSFSRPSVRNIFLNFFSGKNVKFPV